MIVGTTFFLLYAIERLAVERVFGESHGHSHSHGGDFSKVLTTTVPTEAHGHSHAHGEAAAEAAPAAAINGVTIGVDGAAETASSSSVAAPLSPTGGVIVRVDDSSLVHAPETDAAGRPFRNELELRRAKVRGWVFFVALSIHALMDGLSVGAERSWASWGSLIAAVAGHKVFDGVALGVPLYLAGFTIKSALAPLALSAFATPVGVAIGLGVMEGVKGVDGTLASAIISSISGGSFLYISVTELLPAAFEDGRWVKTKLAAAFLGFAALAIIAAWA
jgi:zinc transporter ZupT